MRIHIDIGGRPVGGSNPCFIIAEAGVNHDGDLDIARQLVDVAAESGADAVKFQTFDANDVAVPAAPKAAYQMALTDQDESQHAMLRRLQLSDADHRALMDYCKDRGIVFLSSPFGMRAADYLAELGVPAFKVPSGEVTNIDLLRHIARFGKPVILSTGMATHHDVAVAVEALRAEGCDALIVLHCVSNYPADPSDSNLRAMAALADAFSVPVGYSDHVIGNEVAFAAVALGACVVEKHLTLDRDRAGPDHAASMSPAQLGELIVGIRTIESALGHGRKEPAASERAVAEVARRSLVAATDIPKGRAISDAMITARRPGTGLPPAEKPNVVGRTANRDIAKNTLIMPEMLT